MGARCQRIQAAVVVIVIQALIRVATRTLHTARYWLIAALAFIALFVFDLPFPLVIVCAGLIGGVTGSMTDTEPVDRVVSTPESQATPDSQTTLGSQLLCGSRLVSSSQHWPP